MLELRNISKQYKTSDLVQKALDDVSLAFRESEFVAVLGPSGSGKTTLLNIIGGLDRYDSGDLIINAVSTKAYSDRDWDIYRNHTIGFVFQSYNIIPHQSVLANVELALTISGVSKAERRRRAKEALRSVGLGDQLHKRPNQMSGGQMQRVAIARALVNDPDVLLADEPTGALDSETSVQVMELLQQVAKDRLVIMVTHNGELADQYATRTVRLKDGKIISDTRAFDPNAEKTELKTDADIKRKKTSMSFFTALSLSINNLRTKKGRTLLTAFAGSIGITGIALILSLSTGIHNYVSDIQRSTLASYPITLEKNPNNIIKTFLDVGDDTSGSEESRDDAVRSDPRIYRMLNAAFSGNDEENNIAAFKEYLDAKLADKGSELNSLISAVQYGYEPSLNVFLVDNDGEYRNADISKAIFTSSSDDDATGMSMFNLVSSRMSSANLWSELLPGKDGELVSELLRDKYELAAGRWAEKANEIVLIVDENNSISDTAFYALGCIDAEEIKSIMTSIFKGEKIEETARIAAYDEILGKSFKLVLNHEMYRRSESSQNQWEYIGDDDKLMDLVIKNGFDLTVVGIIRAKSNGAMQISGAFGYTHLLTEYVIEKAEAAELIAEQKSEANKNIDIVSGLPFIIEQQQELSDSAKASEIKAYFASLNDTEKADMYTAVLALPDKAGLDMTVASYLQRFPTRESRIELAASTFGVSREEMENYLADYTDDELDALMVEQITAIIVEKCKENAEFEVAGLLRQYSAPGDIFGSSGYIAVAAIFDERIAGESEDTLAVYYDKFMPSKVSTSTLKDRLKEFGAVDFDDPDTINIYVSSFEDKEAVAKVIEDYNEAAEEDDKIEYTDYVAKLMSGITTIIDAISYGLIAFVAISLVVSSIMIGIITYISVLERTKEIGILRSIGASKRDIRSVFNAETLTVGFFAGLIGIGVTLLLTILMNIILQKLTGIANLKAVLPLKGAIVLVLVSMILTLISGLIPAGIAAKKDPVLALRAE